MLTHTMCLQQVLELDHMLILISINVEVKVSHNHNLSKRCLRNEQKPQQQADNFPNLRGTADYYKCDTFAHNCKFYTGDFKKWMLMTTVLGKAAVINTL